ncbi:tyrosine-type recombinase/integrase [Enterobacteriaceae bacterium Kacie_13]|nr:tyrosine-type recombinase/integrase [Enterobacteriaceae bacterium Kacie_13]
MTIRRNCTKLGAFTLPKTDAGTDRVIYLIKPAIDALKNQAELTRLSKQHRIEVNLREYGRAVSHACTFVFSPRVTRHNENSSYHYAVGSLSAIWETALKRAGLKYRKAYQSRHTYACWSLSAGANPSFIASQMGHSSAQMVFNVYGSWMPESSAEQVTMLNQKLSTYVPCVPHEVKGAV